MADAIDINAYFRRIGYTGERTPSLETLRGINLLHTEAISFENLDPFLCKPVRLDAPSIEKKLVHDGRGGYCFEHNLLMFHVLKSLGFSVMSLAGRVLWTAPEGTNAPRTHMLLHVTLNGAPYIADPGFGSRTLTWPLWLEPNIEQTTPHGTYRLVPSGEEFVLQTRVDRSWRSMYSFDLRREDWHHYEVVNWYLSTHPDSPFRKRLVAARSAPGCRYGLKNNELTFHDLNGRVEERILRTPAQLRDALEGTFRIRLPEWPDLDEVLKRLTAQGA